MTTTLHRDNWEQYAAICEQEITSLKAEIERLRKEHDDLLTQALGVEAEHDLARVEIARLQTALIEAMSAAAQRDAPTPL